jgi:hypothetical protein
MASLLFDPNPQFCDPNGKPYAGGSLATYIAGTSTPKTTWYEHTGTAANSNPIILDSAGRCIMFGDGEYRLVLKDAAGNLVFDQYSTTIVSAAMEPVVAAPTLPDAMSLLGVDDAIAAEASARTSADSAEQTARIAADNAEASARAAADSSEAAARNATDGDLHNQIVAETNRATAAEASLSSQISGTTSSAANAGYELTTYRTVTVSTDGSGMFSCSWSPAFSHAVKGISVSGPVTAQAGATFTGVALDLSTCSGTLSNSNGFQPSPGITPAASITFTFRVDGW